MDIFPRDSVPDNIFSEKLHKFSCFCIRKILWSAVGRYAEENPFLRSWYQFLYYFSKPWIYAAYHGLVKVSGKDDTELVRALTFPVPGEGKGYRRCWYKGYTDIEFEGHTFMVETGYREWLSYEFHDYMKLPPVEKRKTHPVTEIKFPEEVGFSYEHSITDRGGKEHADTYGYTKAIY